MPHRAVRVVVTDCDHDGFVEERAVARREGVAFEVCRLRTDDEIADRCAGADGILVQYARITAALLDRLPQLRAIGRYGVGVDSVDVVAATARGVVVCNVPDYGTESVSDHAIALALAVSRALLRFDRQVRAGRFDLAEARPLHQTAGRVFGVVGLGRIGGATARKAAGLGYEVIGHDVLAEPGRRFRGVPAVALDELLARAQVISLHVPLDHTTRGMIGAAQLARMRPDAVVVNTARGGLIDTDALVGALRAGAVAGAAIDCQEEEPLPVDHPLAALDTVLLTPHVAWYTEESYGELKRRTMQNVVDVLRGRDACDVVNPEVLAAARSGLSQEGA